MAVIFQDGFDWYTTADATKRGWTLTGGSNVNMTISPPFARAPSGQGMQCGGSSGLNNSVSRAFAANYVSGCVGFAWQRSAVLNQTLMTILDTGAEQISIRTTGTGVLTVTRGGTVLATGTTLLAANTWYYVELKFTIAPTTGGTIELHLNGATEIASTSGLNTRSTSVTQWNGIAPLFQVGTSAAGYYDDIYVLDTSTGDNTTFLGPVQVVASSVASTGTHADWSSNAGTNYGAVSETYEDGDASFNASATANQIDSFKLRNLPVGASSTVFSAELILVARQDAGAQRSVAPFLRTADGTDRPGTGQNTATSYALLSQRYERNPQTNAAWTPDAIAALEAGYKLIS